MSEHPSAWFVVADGGRARILARRPDGRFETVTEIVSAAVHRRSRELGSDAPGRAFESTGGSRHALAPRSDPHRRAKADFASIVADQVNEAAARGEFVSLALVAPPAILAEIKGHLDDAAAGRLVGVLAKDLAKLPENELRERLAEIGAPLAPS
jgi:protein required for attachment to host cells